LGAFFVHEKFLEYKHEPGGFRTTHGENRVNFPANIKKRKWISIAMNAWANGFQQIERMFFRKKMAGFSALSE